MFICVGDVLAKSIMPLGLKKINRHALSIDLMRGWREAGVEIQQYPPSQNTPFYTIMYIYTL